MINIRESELKNILKEFNNSRIKIIIKGALVEEIQFNNAIFKYTMRSGNIEIKDRTTQNIFSINTFLAYKISRDNDFTIIELYMDNDLEIKIKKI